MTITIVSSENREVRIGFDQPFCVIGERINPTGRKVLSEEMKNGDFTPLIIRTAHSTSSGETAESGLRFFSKKKF